MHKSVFYVVVSSAIKYRDVFISLWFEVLLNIETYLFR